MFSLRDPAVNTHACLMDNSNITENLSTELKNQFICATEEKKVRLTAFQSRTRQHSEALPSLPIHSIKFPVRKRNVLLGDKDEEKQ